MNEAISPALHSTVASRRWDARRIALISGLAILLLVAGGIITLVGQRLLGGGISPNEVRITSYQDWRVACPAVTPQTPNCALSTEFTRPPLNGNPGGTMLTLQMSDPAPDSTMTIIVPHGVLLEPGLAFTIGNEPMRVRPYETCSNAGCIALVTVDADTLKSLRSNTSGQVTVAAPNAQQPVNIPFSLKGFADGYAALAREHARRTGLFSFLTHS
jgi:invasion protein IalB